MVAAGISSGLTTIGLLLGVGTGEGLSTPGAGLAPTTGGVVAEPNVASAEVRGTVVGAVAALVSVLLVVPGRVVVRDVTDAGDDEVVPVLPVVLVGTVPVVVLVLVLVGAGVGAAGAVFVGAGDDEDGGRVAGGWAVLHV